jgi:hypothetical protein
VAPSDGPSVGLESGVNYLKGCHSNIFDLALQRNFRFGGGKNIQIRLEAFNAFDHVVFSGTNSTLELNSPTNPTMRDSQLLADGTVDPTKLRPTDSGFGGVSSASTLRNLQATIRFNW